MREYISLGPTPYEEECAQVGTPDYYQRAWAECKRTKAQLRQQLGPEPEGALLAIKESADDFGAYLEVVCYYDSAMPESRRYALTCDSEFPAYWNDRSNLHLDEEQSAAVLAAIIAQIDQFQRQLASSIYTDEEKQSMYPQLESLKQVSRMIRARA